MDEQAQAPAQGGVDGPVAPAAHRQIDQAGVDGEEDERVQRPAHAGGHAAARGAFQLLVERGRGGVQGGVHGDLLQGWVSDESEPLAPDHLAKVAAGQQGERAGDDAGADVEHDHDQPVRADAPVPQVPERQRQRTQRDGHQQVDGRVAGDVGQAVVTDEHGRDGDHEHQRDPGVARRAVQHGARLAAAARPQRHGADGQRRERGAEVDGDDGGELHGGLRWVRPHCRPPAPRAPRGRDETARRCRETPLARRERRCR